ncbi:MAG: YdbL family protein [Pseudomonadota bacterium]|nr:YdbL family protein [Pseudomonadota bacterium]
MKMIKTLIATVALLLSMVAFALDLDAAKDQGLVGEQPDGYLGVVKATPAAVELVADINQKRRAAYERIAKQNGITLDQVARLAGQKAIDKTDAGDYVRTPEGQWVTK